MLEAKTQIAAVDAIRQAIQSCSNWGRWGKDDVLGTLNFIDSDKRARAAATVRSGKVFSLALPFDGNGPQNGWKNRNNPVHTMMATGYDAVAGVQGWPHGFSGADDAVFMPLQCGTQWDGLGHIFDHGRAWNDRPADEVVTMQGDLFTGMEVSADQIISRGVLLDVGRQFGANGVLPDGFAIGPEHLEETIEAQGQTARVERGDIVMVRTGQLSRVGPGSWGNYAGGDAPGLSFRTAEWLHKTEIAAVATDTWGMEVRPNEFPNSWQPLHQVLIPHIGMMIGEMWALEGLADDCAQDGVYESFLVAPPLPFTGAVGSPINPIAIK